MVGHRDAGFGLRRPNGQAGAPVVGVERTQIGSAADVRQRGIRETDSQAAARQQVPKTKSRIPKFADDPLRTMAFALSEGALAFAGRPTNLPRLLELESKEERAAQARELEQASLELRQDALALKAFETGADRMVGQSPEEAKATIALVKKISPDAGDFLEAAQKAGAEKLARVMEGLKELPEYVKVANSPV